MGSVGNKPANHYLVVEGRKIYQIINAPGPGGGRVEVLELRDVDKIFQPRTETDSYGKTHKLRPYRYFQVFRKKRDK